MAPDDAKGVVYEYAAGTETISAPGSCRTRFSAQDAPASAATRERGGTVHMTQASLATFTFEDDPVGTIPSGFESPFEYRNDWHVARTDDPGLPDTVTVSGHGKAAWFGSPAHHSYRDPAAGPPPTCPVRDAARTRAAAPSRLGCVPGAARSRA